MTNRQAQSAPAWGAAGSRGRRRGLSDWFAVGCSVRQEALWKLGLLHFIG